MDPDMSHAWLPSQHLWPKNRLDFAIGPVRYIGFLKFPRCFFFQIYCRKSPICLRICVANSETLATNLSCPDTETCHMGLPKTGTVQQLQPQLGDRHVTSEPCWMYMWYMRYMRMHYVHCILTVYIYIYVYNILTYLSDIWYSTYLRCV